MSFHLRRTSRARIRRVDSGHASGNATGRVDAGARWDASGSRASTGSATPRLGSVVLAIVVVVLLTIGLHVLFQ